MGEVNASVVAIIAMVASFILGLTTTAMATALYCYVSTHSLSFLNLPLVLIGIILLLISFLCSCNDALKEHPHFMLCFALCPYVILYSVLAGYTIFAVSVSAKGSGHSLPGRSYKEYRLEDYHHWLINKVNYSTSNWDSYKTHLLNKDVCSEFSGTYKHDTLAKFYKEDLSPIQAGCCKPPDNCNFTYVRPTTWIMPQNQTLNGNSNGSSGGDCDIWDSALETRCFNCQSCKAGFLQEVKKH